MGAWAQVSPKFLVDKCLIWKKSGVIRAPSLHKQKTEARESHQIVSAFLLLKFTTKTQRTKSGVIRRKPSLASKSGGERITPNFVRLLVAQIYHKNSADNIWCDSRALLAQANTKARESYQVLSAFLLLNKTQRIKLV